MKRSLLTSLSISTLLVLQPVSALNLTTYVTEWSGYGSNQPGQYPAYPFDGSYPNSYHNTNRVANPDMQYKAQRSDVLAFAFLQVWNHNDPNQAPYLKDDAWDGQLHFDDIWGDLPSQAVPDEYQEWKNICADSSAGTCAAVQLNGMTQQKELMNFNTTDIGQMNNFGAFLHLPTSAKKIISIGGANTLENGSISTWTYKAIFAHPDIFVQSLSQLVAATNNQIEGVDLDFEPPINASGATLKPDSQTLEDYKNLYNLVALIRQKMGAGFYISVTLTMNEGYLEYIQNSVSGGWFKSVSPYVDVINVMTYDMHGPWDQTSDPGALPHALLKVPSTLTHTYAINYGAEDVTQKLLQSYGLPANKLQLGLAAYGRGFTGVPAGAYHGLDQPWTGAAIFPAQDSNQEGLLPYWAVSDLLKNYGFQSYTVKDKDSSQVIGDYLYNGNQFVGYEGTDEEQALCDYEQKNGLQGSILWSMDTDVKDESENSLINYYYAHCASS